MKNSRRFVIEAIVIALLLIIAIFIWFNDYKNKQEIQSNKGVTEAVIVDYELVGPDNYYLTYKYYVDGKMYRNRIMPDFLFKNCEKTKKCLGKKFKVYFSMKNPEKSEIDLNKEIE